mmetsp:Transcript_9436/g.25596  ORF Transcript_9436/g.25596 Transcript_9436/m.25596 type:complete len:247 (-) Transcript_9436:565-1305(-)
MEPAHEEHARGEPMRHEHQRRVPGKSTGVDVADQVVLEQGHAVVHVCARLAVREPVEEPAESQSLGFFPLLTLGVLEVAKVLLPELHFFLDARDSRRAERLGHALVRLLAPQIGRRVEEQVGVTGNLFDHDPGIQRLPPPLFGERHLRIRHVRVRLIVHVALRLRVTHQNDPLREYPEILRRGLGRRAVIPRVEQANQPAVVDVRLPDRSPCRVILLLQRLHHGSLAFILISIHFHRQRAQIGRVL